MPVLLLLSLRSLVAHRGRSLVVGGILVFTTFLAVFGSAVFTSVREATRRGVTQSLVGDLQVYAADAPDPLAIFGGLGLTGTDVGEMPEIERVEAAVRAVPGVREVVPMGIQQVTVFGEDEVDRALRALRAASDAGDGAGVAAARTRVRGLARSLAEGHGARASAGESPEKVAEDAATLARVSSDAFWTDFDADPAAGLETLEMKLAPLAADGRVFFLRAIGTDITQFGRAFTQFYVVDGQVVPEGRRGLLLSKRTYERLLKNKVAREFDTLHLGAEEERTIVGDDRMREAASRLRGQAGRLAYQLSDTDVAALIPRLQALIGSTETEPRALLAAFLDVDDTTLAARYAFFYAEIAPRIRLYEVPIGGEVTLRSLTKSGYSRAATVRVWGTYELRGLEKSDLVSASNLLDLVTWRELYGRMSDGQLRELDAIRAEVGVRDVDRENVEDALFGASAPEAVVREAPVAVVDPEVTVSGPVGDTFDPAELRRGLALNAAVILEDPDDAEAVSEAIRAVSARDGLGIQVVGWQEAATLLGQFVSVMQGVLIVSVSVMSLVAMVILNNTLVASTLQRAAEIGTIRAIGGQRWFVAGLFLVETLAIGMVATSVGVLLAAGAVAWLAAVGIPAPADAFVLLFAGPRLYPTLGGADVGFGVGSVLAVSLLSSVYPAVLASRVPPVVAMRVEE